MSLKRLREMASSMCSPAHLVAESIFFMFKIGEALLEPSLRLFIYQSVCIQEYPNDTSCDHLHQYPDRENHVQHVAAAYFMYYKLILNLPAIFVGLFCGAWSDRIGRKMPVLLSSFGTIIAVLFFMMAMVTDSRGVPLLPLVFVGAAVRGAFGKSAIMTMALHSYVSDISSEEMRTQKLGKLLSMNYFGYFVGSLLAGAVLESSGFDVVFCLVVIFNCLCVIVAVLFMHESVPPSKSESSAALTDAIDPPDAVAPDQEEGSDSVGQSGRRRFRVPFRWKHVRESVDVLIRARPQRNHIIFLFCTIFIQQMCKSGEVDITLLFTEKSPLRWRKSLYGYLLATDYAMLGLASALLLPGLILVMHLGDATLVVTGVLFKIIRLVVLAFSTETWMVFLSVVVGCPSALIISCAKSLISKAVDEDEMGKTFSLLSSGETLSNFIGSLLFTSIYSATVAVFPGLAFVADAALFFLLFLALLVLAWDMRRMSLRSHLVQDITDGRLHLYGSTVGCPPATTILDSDAMETDSAVNENYPKGAALRTAASSVSMETVAVDTVDLETSIEFCSDDEESRQKAGTETKFTNDKRPPGETGDKD